MAYDAFKGCNLEVSKGPAELGGCRVYISKACKKGGSYDVTGRQTGFYRPIIHSEYFKTQSECDKRYAQIKRRC